ncbi:MAG: ABC transporter substrate-binding protein, partial [Deltaproteobacteria bacterium]|nr:ABC transporter substrate-binding protein [Deltaproteobacteria bacterium]
MRLGAKRNKLLLSLLGLIFLLTWAGPILAADNIKIGVLIPLTGPAAADGQSAKQSVEMAVEKVNSGGGVNGKKVEAIFYDDQFDPKQAVTLARRMIEADKVLAAVSGSYSGPTRAASQIFQENKVPFSVGYALHPDVTKGGKYVFRVTVLGHIQGRAAGWTAGNLMKVKTAAMLVM